jgi:hypothetical protein
VQSQLQQSRCERVALVPLFRPIMLHMLVAPMLLTPQPLLNRLHGTHTAVEVLHTAPHAPVPHFVYSNNRGCFPTASFRQFPLIHRRFWCHSTFQYNFGMIVPTLTSAFQYDFGVEGVLTLRCHPLTALWLPRLALLDQTEYLLLGGTDC